MSSFSSSSCSSSPLVMALVQGDALETNEHSHHQYESLRLRACQKEKRVRHWMMGVAVVIVAIVVVLLLVVTTNSSALPSPAISLQHGSFTTTTTTSSLLFDRHLQKSAELNDNEDNSNSTTGSSNNGTTTITYETDDYGCIIYDAPYTTMRTDWLSAPTTNDGSIDDDVLCYSMAGVDGTTTTLVCLATTTTGNVDLYMHRGRPSRGYSFFDCGSSNDGSSGSSSSSDTCTIGPDGETDTIYAYLPVLETATYLEFTCFDT